jgi:hypothetical protein
MKIKELFETAAVGYIAKNKKEANDPRYSMSITQDIKPGEVERQAKKFGNKFPPPIMHSKAAKNSTPNKLMNLGLSESIVDESRGVTARVAGERYVNDKDPNDFRTIDIINPPDAPAYKTAEELQAIIKKTLPKNAIIVHDNKQGSDMRAAIIAKVATPDNNVEYWIRYIKAVPPTGVHSLWQTLRGYSYDNPRSASEKIKLKPSDLIKDDSPKTLDELVEEITASITAMGDEELLDAMSQAVSQASHGKDIVIKNGVKYAVAISKYAGEYLGAMVLMSGKLIEGDIKKAMSALDIKTLKGSKITFPQARLQELYDSTLTTKDGKTLQISTKMHKTGSGSSLSGVVKQLNDDIESRYPKGAKVLRMLGGESSGAEGVLRAAVAYKILGAADVQEIKSMNLGSKDPNIIVSLRLKELLAGQKVTSGANKRPGYTIRRHLMAAIANKTIAVINKDDQVLTALMLALNNNNYLQVVTVTTISGNDVNMKFYTKYPTEFTGKPQLQNAAFWSTGEQGRIAFSLPSTDVSTEIEEPKKELPIKRKPADITAIKPRLNPSPKGVGRAKR